MSGPNPQGRILKGRISQVRSRAASPPPTSPRGTSVQRQRRRHRTPARPRFTRRLTPHQSPSSSPVARMCHPIRRCTTTTATTRPPSWSTSSAPPRWPWVVGVAAIIAAIALVASVSVLVTRTDTDNLATPETTTTTAPPVQDAITTTTPPPPPPPPPPTTEPPPPPPPETVTVTQEPPPRLRRRRPRGAAAASGDHRGAACRRPRPRRGGPASGHLFGDWDQGAR